MSSGKPGSNESAQSGVLGPDGTIDLVGHGSPRPASHKPTIRPSGDAWLIDRGRRSLLPPRPPTLVPGHAGDAQSVPDDIHEEIADRFALGDYAAALSAAELQLGLDPADEDARRYAATSRERLELKYVTRIGSLDYIFDLAVPTAKVKWLGLDPQAASLLGFVDGQTTVAEALQLCSLGRLEALRVFTELLDAKAIVRVA